MSKTIMLAVACALIASPGWTSPRGSASRDSADVDGTNPGKEEQIGVGGGAALGAAAGGPVGLIIGAALGGWLGDKFHRERGAREDVEARYEQVSAEASSLEMLLDDSERDLADLRAVLERQRSDYQSALNDALNLEVFFHTGEAALEARTLERLARLGRVMQVMDDFTVVIEGHADARGDEEYNAQLSAERAASVREALIQAGLPADRITSLAAGERDSTAAEDDLDSLALERRVDLSVVAPVSSQRVARQ